MEGENTAATLQIDNQKIPVLAFDESDYGIGVVSVNAPQLRVGNAVLFSSSGREVSARVASLRYVNTLFACIYCIGLEWVE